MQLLPHKVGQVTLMRRLGTDGITESFVGILDEPAGKTVLARRIVPGILKDPSRLALLEARLGDLVGIRHPSLVPVLREVSADGERLVLEDWTEALSLERIIAWCAKHGQAVPHNVFLNLATQICNGLEALHSRPGAASGAEAVLHLALHPGSVWVGIDGKVLVGGFGLFRSPVTNAQNDSGNGTMRLEYMAPEQTHLDQKLGPPTDVFALGALLYEMLTGKTMFRAESNLQTIHRIRRAEVTTHLLEVREAFPGLDRVLYRALSLNPRHRYQRAFVLREDLRGLMAGFSFSTITEDTRAFLAPIFMRTRGGDEPTSDTPIGFPTSEPAMSREATPLPQTDTGVLLLGGLAPGGPTLRPVPAGEGRVPTPLDAPPRAAFPTQPPAAPAVVRPEVSPQSLPPIFGFGGLTDEVPMLAARGAAPLAAPPGATPQPAPTGRAPNSRDDVTSWEVRATPPTMDFGDFDEGNTGVTKPRIDTAPPAPHAGAPPTRAAAPEALAGNVAIPTSRVNPTLTPADERTSPAPAPTRATPAPGAHRAPNPAAARRSEVADDEAPSREWLPIALVGGAIGLGLVAVLVCAGSGALGLLSAGDDPVAAAPPAVEAPAAPPPEPTAPATATAAPEPPVVAEVPAPPPPAAPPPRPAPVAAAPRPAPVAPAPRPAPVAAPPAPKPAPVAAAPPPAPVVAAARATPPAPAPVAAPPRPAPAPVAAPAPLPAPAPQPIVMDSATLSAMGVRATRGDLAAADRAALEALAPADPLYNRGYTLLYQDAKTRGDLPSRRSYLDKLLAVPENQYRPELLIEAAQMSFDRRDWSGAITWSQRAEQHWARLPSDLVFNRKAMIYELQAGAWTNTFFASEGEDDAALANAIRSWEKYRTHVATQPSQGLVTRADQQLARLIDARQRLQ